MSETHRRVIVSRHGGPEELQWTEEPVPTPESGEARVAVQAAGVAFADVLVREGLYPGAPRPPVTPGYDLVGVVEEVGPGVQAVSVGDRVAALTETGSYAEKVCVCASKLVPVPDGLDAAEAVSLVLNYVTAQQMLHRLAKVSRGQRILVHGAAGGVGTALLQLGALHDLEMYGTASAAKHVLVEELGGIPIDYRSEDFRERIKTLTGDGVDAVFDAIGGWQVWRSHRCLRRGGTLVLYGVSAMTTGGRSKDWLAGPVTGALYLSLKLLPDRRRVTFYAIDDEKPRNRHPFHADLKGLFERLAAGEIAPIIAERIAMSEVQRAHELLGRAAVRGKIVLVP